MSQDDIYIGKDSDPYHIEQEIASDSFGTVYLSSSALPGMPTRAFYPPASNMTATSPIDNPIVSATYPPMPASSAESGPVSLPLLRSSSPVSPQRPAGGATINPRHIPPKRNKRISITVVLIILLLLILSASAWAILAHLPQATITITPFSKTLQNTFILTGVNGPSNIANRQISVRQLTSTKTATKPVTLTYFHQDPTSAKGSITFFNSSFKSQTITKASVTFQVSNVTIVIDQDTVIPGALLSGSTVQPGQVIVSAHVLQTGAAGNIATLAIDRAPCCGSQNISAQNLNAFTGGTDIVDYNYLKPTDVNAVTNADQGLLQTNAQHAITQQKKPGDQFLGNITCDDPKTTESVQPNVPVATATTTASVTVSVTCNVQVYDANAAQTIAHNNLSQKATTNPQLGPDPIQSGPITTQIEPQTRPDGSITFSVTVISLWYYNWTDTKNPHIQLNIQRLLDQIKGVSQTQAQHILNNYPGISNATITINNSATTLPSNINQITLKINAPQAPSSGQ